MNDSAVVRLPRDPGLELLFSLEAGRDRFGLAPVGVFPDADAKHLRGPGARHSDKRGIALSGETARQCLRFTTIVNRRDLHDEALPRRLAWDLRQRSVGGRRTQSLW